VSSLTPTSRRVSLVESRFTTEIHELKRHNYDAFMTTYHYLRSGHSQGFDGRDQAIQPFVFWVGWETPEETAERLGYGSHNDHSIYVKINRLGNDNSYEVHVWRHEQWQPFKDFVSDMALACIPSYDTLNAMWADNGMSFRFLDLPRELRDMVVGFADSNLPLERVIEEAERAHMMEEEEEEKEKKEEEEEKENEEMDMEEEAELSEDEEEGGVELYTAF